MFFSVKYIKTTIGQETKAWVCSSPKNARYRNVTRRHLHSNKGNILLRTCVRKHCTLTKGHLLIRTCIHKH